MTKKGFLGLLIAMVLAAQFMIGGVNLKNGNFFISYTDITFGDQYVYDEIVRTYNSKSTFTGLFGYGWGSDIDTFIKFYPDGSIVLKEHGGGRTVNFSTAFYDESLRDEMIETLVDAAINEGDIKNTPEAMLGFRERIRNNAELRNAYWDKYLKNDQVEAVDTYAMGTVWEAFESGNLMMTKTEKGYALTNKSQTRNELFNNKGKLIRKEEKNGGFVELLYSENGQLQKIMNDDGTSAEFKLNADGRVTEITFNEAKATFIYDGENLVKSVDTGGNKYLYSYDNVHNLTGIEYDNGTKKIIEYYPGTYYTKKIENPDGEVTEYEYEKFYSEDGTENKDRYATAVIKNQYGETVRNYYEYWIKTDPQGNRYNYRIIEEVNGFRTTTYYDEICSLPLKIVRGQDSTSFTYNNRCLLTEKIPTNGDPVRMRYHDTLEKIVQVENGNGITTFKYDEKGNLTYAQNGTGETVTLSYNDRGKILTMHSNEQVLNFTYNDAGKPILVEMENEGSIQIEYDEYGEITRVSSEDGYKVSLKVTQAFQNLLAIVKPSGVNLGI